MASYKTEIEIGVIGVGKIAQLKSSLEQVSKTVDILNRKRIDQGFNIQNLNTYNNLLGKAWQNINKAAMGSQEELKAVENLVTAKNRQIAAQERLNALIAKEELAQKRIVATANAGFGEQGPKLPPGSSKSPKGGLGFNPDATAENLALGAGFPLLFGGGAGQVAGGLLGSFFGSGFGGQILGSALGQQLEDATRRITEIGSALQELNMKTLQDSAILVTAELTTQVRLLQEAGRADEARAAIADQVTQQTGLLPEVVSDITNNTNLLGNTWNEFLGAVSGTLAILSAPFVTALTVIFQGLSKILQAVNLIASGIGLILKNVVEWVGKLPFAQQILGFIQEKTKALLETEEARVAALQKLTGGQVKELVHNQKMIQLEAQRTLGRTTAEKQINAEIDKQLANDRIRNEYAAKAKQLREEYGNVTSEAGKRELELALQANSALEAQALKQQAIKDLLAAQALQIEINTEKYNRAADAVQRQIASLERGNQVQQSRFSAEAALNDLYGTQLQRQYELATNAQQRYNIAIAMFQQQVKAAQIEYQQALLNNKLLVDKTILETKLIELKYQQLDAEKAIAIAQAQARGNTQEQISAIATAYDQALSTQKEVVAAAHEQVAATAEIAANQNIVADAVYKTKIIQAESQLAQKLVSNEIGMSKTAANNLAGSLAVGVMQARNLSTSMRGVAANAANAAVQLRNAIALQSQLAAKAAAYAGGGTPQRIAGTGYVQTGRNTYEAVYQNANGTTGTGFIQAHYAQGGYVTRPTNAMVGEGGEPEYIVPQSKATRFAANWMAGNRGESAIPRGSSASPANVQVSVQTGPVLQQDGQRYVTLGDLEGAMQTVVNSLLGNGRSAGGRRYTGVA